MKCILVAFLNSTNTAHSPWLNSSHMFYISGKSKGQVWWNCWSCDSAGHRSKTIWSGFSTFWWWTIWPLVQSEFDQETWSRWNFSFLQLVRGAATLPRGRGKVCCLNLTWIILHYVCMEDQCWQTLCILCNRLWGWRCSQKMTKLKKQDQLVQTLLELKSLLIRYCKVRNSYLWYLNLATAFCLYQGSYITDDCAVAQKIFRWWQTWVWQVFGYPCNDAQA